MPELVRRSASHLLMLLGARWGKRVGWAIAPPARKEGIDSMASAIATLRALVLLAAGVSAGAEKVAAGEDLDEITSCVKANQPKLSAEQTVTMRTLDRTGSARVSSATIYWQKSGENSQRF